jgi:hypothetical protein
MRLFLSFVFTLLWVPCLTQTAEQPRQEITFPQLMPPFKQRKEQRNLLRWYSAYGRLLHKQDADNPAAREVIRKRKRSIKNERRMVGKQDSNSSVYNQVTIHTSLCIVALCACLVYKYQEWVYQKE